MSINSPVYSVGLVRPRTRLETGTAYTCQLADEQFILLMENEAAIQVTIENDSVVAYPIGYSIHIHQWSTGQVEITQAAGVLINTPLSLFTRTQNSAASLIKVSPNTWVLIGDMGAQI